MRENCKFVNRIYCQLYTPYSLVMHFVFGLWAVDCQLTFKYFEGFILCVLRSFAPQTNCLYSIFNILALVGYLIFWSISYMLMQSLLVKLYLMCCSWKWWVLMLHWTCCWTGYWWMWEADTIYDQRYYLIIFATRPTSLLPVYLSILW